MKPLFAVQLKKNGIDIGESKKSRRIAGKHGNYIVLTGHVKSKERNCHGMWVGIALHRQKIVNEESSHLV